MLQKNQQQEGKQKINHCHKILLDISNYSSKTGDTYNFNSILTNYQQTAIRVSSIMIPHIFYNIAQKYNNTQLTFDFSGIGLVTITFSEGYWSYDQIQRYITESVLQSHSIILTFVLNQSSGLLQIQSDRLFKLQNTNFLELLGLQQTSSYSLQTTGLNIVDLVKVKYFIVVCSISKFNTYNQKNMQFLHFVPTTGLSFGSIGCLDSISEKFTLSTDSITNSMFLEFLEPDGSHVNWRGKYPSILFEITD